MIFYNNIHSQTDSAANERNSNSVICDAKSGTMHHDCKISQLSASHKSGCTKLLPPLCTKVGSVGRLAPLRPRRPNHLPRVVEGQQNDNFVLDNLLSCRRAARRHRRRVINNCRALVQTALMILFPCKAKQRRGPALMVQK